MQSVGTVEQLARFPVKSMRGGALPSVVLSLQGLPLDRRYAFVQAESRSSFPWLTARQLPELLCYQTSIEGEDSPEETVTVTAPDGETLRIDSPEMRRKLEERSGRQLFLLHDYRGSYDAAPVSLISRQTVARIAEESGVPEDPWRFRPNLLINLEDGKAFDELNWAGRILRMGNEARISITEVNVRCMMINLDPKDAKTSPEVLRSVAQQHEKCAGIYATVLTAGRIEVGDRVVFEN